VFVDADVCVTADAAAVPGRLFGEPASSAVFGAYDTEPHRARPRLAVPQPRASLRARHAGRRRGHVLGRLRRVRRADFQRAGRFDAQRYPRPQIEDIELGYRLRSLGCRILLRPDIQGTHLKRWTLLGMVRNDVRDRGMPWMRLLLARAAVGNGTLNVRAEDRLLTAAAGLAVLALAIAPFAGGRILVGFAVACVLLILARNRALFRWFARVRGWRFALGIAPLRLLYYLLNAAAAGIAVLEHLTARLAGQRTGTATSTGDARQPAGPVTTERPARGRTP
jgi:hypothetical protein